MRKLIYFLLPLLALLSCTEQETHVRIAVTTDVHGMIFPYDFSARKESGHSLSHIYSYSEQRRASGDTLFFLLDNGDFLQGQPTVYYYNFVKTDTTHLASRVMNYMGYSAGTVGNHDIEAGPAVYRKVEKEFSFPWLAANAVSTKSGEPAFEPYTILRAGKKRIAVLGLITPGVPGWLPANLWPDMEFHDMVETARHWVVKIRKEEKPDLIVGLFHAGTDASYGGATEEYMNENAVLLVAEQVDGFDLIFAGHDHRHGIEWVRNVAGDSVLVVDPGSHARFAGEVSISFGPGGRVMKAENIPMKNFRPSSDFLETFRADRIEVSNYLSDTVAWLEKNMDGRSALYGSSGMISLIHDVQLSLSGADISFTAPLSINSILEEGPLLVSDMFKLYRFENLLYTMALKGSEADAYLEHGVSGWFSTMSKSDDPFLLYDEERPGRLANPYYNFSSAAGIDYTVDVRKAPGDRVEIKGFSNGAPFYSDSIYRVAINSYRGNGGGGHLTDGAGIPREELKDRILWSSDIDLRYHIMKYLNKQKHYSPYAKKNWSCIPEDWVLSARMNSEFDK